MSVASPMIPLLTADDLDGFPDDGKRREIIEGVLYVAAAPSRFHQEVQIRLIVQIGPLVKENRSGSIFAAPVDVRLSDHDLVQPDLIFIRRDRLGFYQGNTVRGAPDVVMEILSPTNRGYDLIEKAQLYERHRVPEFWIFDPVHATIAQRVLVDGRHMQIVPEDGLYHSTIIPGLVIDPDVLFSDLDE